MLRLALVTLFGLTTATGAPGEEILVGAAASLREPVAEIARRFESSGPGPRVILTFGGSNLLAGQIRAGAPIDVFLSADERSVAGLAAEALVDAGSQVTFAGNRLVVVQSEGFEFPLTGPEDLARGELRRFALPDDAVPVGRYAREWLGRHGVVEALAGRIVRTKDARATLAAVDLGHADAAIVYATDAALARRARIAFVVPEDEQPAIVYVAALTTRGTRRRAAEAFLDFLLGAGQDVLREAGFRRPPPAAVAGAP